MTNNNDLALKLKAAAEVIATEHYTDDQWFHYLRLAHHSNILALLAEHDADKAENAQLHQRVAELERQLIAPLPIGELIQRLSDQTGEDWSAKYLEERTVIVKPAEEYPDDFDLQAAINMNDDYADYQTAQWLKELRRRRATMQAEPVSQRYTLPDGWKLVPVEPTEAMMLHKSGCQHHAWDDADCAMRQTRRLVWAHMLAAVPAAPEQQNEQQNIPENIPTGLIDAVNRLLDSDGSRGCFDLIECNAAHREIERLIAAAPEQEV